MSAFGKEVLRSIRQSLGRFVAIAIIAALGTGFYAGLKMTSPDMQLAGDMYYDGTNTYDLRVVSTLGLDDACLAQLAATEGVAEVMGAYEVDATATIDGNPYVVRIHSLDLGFARASSFPAPYQAQSEGANYINRPILVEGRWPERQGECLIAADPVMDAPLELGDRVYLLEGTTPLEDTLDVKTLTIVGLVRTGAYPATTNLGTTLLGSGSIDQFLYVSAEDFADDVPYTEAFIKVEGAAEQPYPSDAYDALVDAAAARLEAGKPELRVVRLASIKDDAQAEYDKAYADYLAERADAEQQLADAGDELARAKAELDDASAELASARRELDDAAATIASSERELADGQAQYDAGAAELAQQKAAAQAQLDEAQAQIDAAQLQYDEAMATRAQLADQLAQAQAGIAAIDAQVPDIAAARAQLQAGLDQANAQMAALQEQLAGVQQQRAAVQAQLDAYPAPEEGDEAYAALVAALAQLQDAEGQLQAGIAQASDAAAQLQAQLTQLDDLASHRAALLEGVAQLEAGIAQIDAQTADAPAQIATAQAQLDAQKTQAAAQFDAAQRQLDFAAAQLASGRAQLESGRQSYANGLAQYNDGLAQYNDGLAQYEDGLAEYQDKRAEADAQFADAEAELADAQADIDALAAPDIYVLDRTKNVGMVSFTSDSNRIATIASVFPLIFFLVAALVSLTTMTRMVEEERVLIGTYKALGYGNGRIISKYLIYAFAACMLGATVGVALLTQFLPWFIMGAYSIVYNPPLRPTPVDPWVAVSSIGLTLAIIVGATWVAATSTLREKPAALMLPRAPKAGKRIVLERVKPLWNRMSFSWKVTARNIFRYKQRFIMAIVGIAGCTALLLTGLGLHDSVNDIIDKQFDELYHFSMNVRVDEDITPDELGQAEALLDDGAVVERFTWAMVEGVVVESAVGTQYQANVLVPQDPDDFADYWTLRERHGGEEISLASNQVVLTEKLASIMGVDVGDEFTLLKVDAIGNTTGEGDTYTVGAIAENYVYHYAFVAPETFEKTTGDQAEFTVVYAQATSDEAARVQLSERLRAIDHVDTVGYIDETVEAYRTMLKTIDSIVYILVIAAALLAFVVIYNLTNINIAERVREIATLKVLGFTPQEVNAYIYRETMLLALIGAAIGLVLGVFLEGFVITTAEVDQVMFGREIHTASFVVAFVLTLVFSAVVTLVMRRKLRGISMVESLKSIE